MKSKFNKFLILITLLCTGCGLLDKPGTSSSVLPSSSEIIEISSSNIEQSSEVEESINTSLSSSNSSSLGCEHIYDYDCDPTCNICGSRRNTMHVYQSKTEVEASQTAFGLQVYACRSCGDVKGLTSIEPLSSSVERPDITKEEYAYLSAVKARKQAKEIFSEVLEKNEKDFFMLPIIDIVRYKELKDFTMDLVKDCETDYQKIETIYTWITKNINYDINAQTYSIYKTFKERKAVCFGFTSLMHDMLSAVDIMSMYTSGYASYGRVTFNDIYSFNRDDKNAHAWLLIYCDDRVVFADPTWGAYNIDSFDLTDEEIKETYITVDTDEINVIPDGIDCRLYLNAIYKLGDFYFNLFDGKINDTGEISIIRNMVYETTFKFHRKNDGYVYKGTQFVNYAYNDGIIYYCTTDDLSLMYYAATNGHSYPYLKMLSYVKILEQEYGKDIDLEFEDEMEVINNLIFRKKDDYYSLVAYTGTETDITIPGEIKGLKVKEIASDAFMNNSILEKITIENGIEIIRNNAFANTINLKEIVIPNTVKTIESAFFGSGITKLEIPDSVESMGGLFTCGLLEELVLPNINFDFGSISGCYSLKSIKFSENNDYYTVEDNVIFDKDKTKLIFYPAGLVNVTYTIPEGIKEIGESAFDSNENLKEVIIPSSVNKLGNRAFYFSNIEKIELPEGIKEIPQEAFFNCVNLISVKLPESLLKIDQSAFSGCQNLENINIPKNIKEIFFGYCPSLREIVVSEENPYLKSVDNVIYSKDGKTLVFYPMGKFGNEYTVLEGTEVIKGSAFSYNPTLKVINLPSGLKKIETGAFCNFKGNYLVIPESVEILETEFVVQCPKVTIYYNWNKETTPSKVWTSSAIVIYYKGQWQYVEGIPTPIK